MRVLMCGSRYWKDRVKIRIELERLLDEVEEFFTIIQGEARGADTLAREEAVDLGINVESFPAQWEAFGKAAGPMRNQAMLDSGVDLVIAFHEDLSASKGTLDMVRRSRKAGVEVKVVS